MPLRVTSALVLMTAMLGASCSTSEPPAPQVASPQPAERPDGPALTPSHSHALAPPQAAGGSATAKRYDGPLPPLPEPGFIPSRPADVVRATYEFAGRHADVLQYIPCFCMCERSGHVGNDDCFVGSRDASGRPTWDLHGMG